jgi:hypothetical protein
VKWRSEWRAPVFWQNSIAAPSDADNRDSRKWWRNPAGEARMIV